MMSDQSKRDDLKPSTDKAGKVGEKNKQMNQQGEAPRPGTPPDPKQR